ncbi:hypothetical protein BGZ72_005433 [Mortierella alpina]|nr:hypothetical protein BGZ72_005433 [Mortierella alpina]
MESTSETTAGLHYEECGVLDPTFQMHNLHFNFKLARLYRVTYTSETRLIQTGQWSEPYYYHCTGNCQCLLKMVCTTLTEKASSKTWCKSAGCPIQSILNRGLMMCFEHHGGHFFSSEFNIAKTYGLHKDPMRKVLAVLICKARDIRMRSDNNRIKYVKKDEHVLPYYLALVHV